MGKVDPIEILLVEDNAGDVRLIEELLKEARVENRMRRVGDGTEALAYLRREPPYRDAMRPDLIVLDLNLPRMNGQEVLAAVKSDGTLRMIPVVILTTSKAHQDIATSYDLHANCYIQKPVDLDQFSGVVRSIENFWLTTVRLPGGTHA
jgi:CheY-like chemotaxis protein